MCCTFVPCSPPVGRWFSRLCLLHSVGYEAPADASVVCAVAPLAFPFCGVRVPCPFFPGLPLVLWSLSRSLFLLSFRSPLALLPRPMLNPALVVDGFLCGSCVICCYELVLEDAFDHVCRDSSFLVPAVDLARGGCRNSLVPCERLLRILPLPAPRQQRGQP
jgi:hypothetical protein